MTARAAKKPRKPAPIWRTCLPLSALDAFCRSREIPRIHALKLDVQGAEMAVLKGSSSLLADARINLIFTEMTFVPHYEGAASVDRLIDFLASYGYSLFNLYEETSARNGQLTFCNALFVSSQVRGTVLDKFPPES